VYAQQFYYRGEVKDESDKMIPYASIVQQSTGYLFKTGSSGNYGILSNIKQDTFIYSMDGYVKQKIAVNADNYTSVKLKRTPASSRRDKLSSLTKDLGREDQKDWFTGDETYASLLENHFVNAKKFPSTGLSPNVDRASYSNIRRFISMKSYVPPDAVRIEEMLNYFNLNYEEPDAGQDFKIQTKLGGCPWNNESQLFFIDLSARKLNLDSLPPSNLVFLIDISGSMDMPNRLPLLKSAFRLLVNNLREKDTVSVVVYGGISGVMLSAASGNDKEKIIKVIDELEPGGFTPGESGIKLAYNVAKKHFIKNGNNRVILATDGDFNVGLKTESELDSLISRERESGIYLTCLGVGMGNYKDSKIQTLAEKGNGNFAYLDNFKEAEKVLLKEFTQMLYSVADDVVMNVVFNPEYVKEYRLIGFDNKVGVLKDTLATVEGGEIGSGHSMMAMFEIIPTELNKGAIRDSYTNGKFVEIKLTYQLPGQLKENTFVKTGYFQFTPFERLDKCYRFSTSISMFGALLRNSTFIKNTSFEDIIKIGEAASNSNDLIQKEFIALVQDAKKLYSKVKKKRNGTE